MVLNALAVSSSQIEVKNGKVLYTDMQSTNGSTLNGDKLDERDPTVIDTGDVLVIGATSFSVRVCDCTEDVSET